MRQAQEGPALLNVLGGLLVLGGSVVLKKLAAAGPAFAWLLVAREALILLFTMLLGWRLLGYRPRPGFRGRKLRDFVAPALIFGLASLIYTIYFNCDVFFVYVIRGKEELGAYAAAFRPINPLLLLPWLLMVPMIPVLTAAANDTRTVCAAGARRVRLGAGDGRMRAGRRDAAGSRPGAVALSWALSGGRAVLRECFPLAGGRAGIGVRYHRV